MLRKLPIVAVFGQGSEIAPDRATLAREVGAVIARLGAHLLTGGGYGVMEAVAQGFTEISPRPGFSMGIVPRRAAGPLDSPNRDRLGRTYPNSFVEIAIMTPLPPRSGDWRSEPARNHINVFTADAAIALPGNSGTRNELDMAAFYKGEMERLRAERHTVLLGPPDEFTDEHRKLFEHVTTPDAAGMHLRRILRGRGYTIEPKHDNALGDAAE